ncbi:STS14 protein [Arachis hypogaea]|nr:STS14 protein [Arachis hypogaea]
MLRGIWHPITLREQKRWRCGLPRKSTTTINPIRALVGWVAEKKYYDHKSNLCIGGDCECYIQVVWRDTTHVGCGRVKCDKCQMRCTLVVCLYSPPGNDGERPY